MMSRICSTVLRHRGARVGDLAAALAGVGARAEVLVHRELGEDAPALHDLGDAAPHDGGRVEPLDLGPLERDAALRDLAAVDVEQAGDGSQRGRLPGAVGPEQGHDLALGHLERDPAQHERGALRSLWVMEQFRAVVAGSPGVRRLLDDEPAVAIRVLTDPMGRVQPLMIERCAALLEGDVEEGHIVALTDVPTLSYAVVRLAESFLYADVLAARTPDLDAARTLIAALVVGGTP